MNIWTFKRSVLCLLIGLALPSCTDGGPGLSFLENGFGRGDNASRQNVALKTATLGDSVLVTPPAGYCIDKTALQKDFAILARCDSLGGGNSQGFADLGMMTVTLVDQAEPVDLLEILQGTAPNDVEPRIVESGDQRAFARFNGGVPVGADPLHWRAVAQIGPYLASFAAYGPQRGDFANEAGRENLAILINNMQEAALTRAIAQDVDQAQGTEQTGLDRLLRGLFNRKPLQE